MRGDLLVMDVGTFDGADIEYYLAKGFRVVAIEASGAGGLDPSSLFERRSGLVSQLARSAQAYARLVKKHSLSELRSALDRSLI